MNFIEFFKEIVDGDVCHYNETYTVLYFLNLNLILYFDNITKIFKKFVVKNL